MATVTRASPATAPLSSFGRWREILLVAVLYFATARVGQIFAITPGNVTPIWLPSGIIIAAVLYRGYAVWPGIFIGAFAGNISAYFTSETGEAFVQSLGAGFFNGVGDTLGAVVGVYLIMRFCDDPYPVNRVRDLVCFILFGAVLSSTISAVFGVTALWANGFITGDEYGTVFNTWLTGDAVGVLVLTPLLLSFVYAERAAVRISELCLYVALVVITSLLAVGPLATAASTALLFALLPFTLWAVLRFDHRVVFGSVLFISAVSITTLVFDIGWFARVEESHHLTELQQFLSIFAASVLLFTALDAERRRAEGRLHEANTDLDIKVAQRTLDLEERNRQLDESQIYLRAMMDSSLTGTYIFNVHTGTSRFINDGYTQLLGYTDDDIEALGPGGTFSLLHPDDVAASQAHVAELVADTENEVYEVEARFKHRRGDWRWLLARNTPFSRDENGSVVEFLGTFLDITERKQTEEQLYEAAAVFLSTSEGIAITDLDSNIVEVNQAFCGITGYTRDEVLGKNPRMLSSGRHDPVFYAQMWSSLRDRGYWRGEIWNRRKDGTVYPELLTINAVRDGRGQATGYVGAFSDITSIKTSQDRLDYLAHRDPLTGLANRLLFNEQLDQAIARSARQRARMAVVFLDLDHFKHVNDSLSHQHGDELLRQVGERLVGTFRRDDTLARLSGDEFIIILEGVSSVDDVSAIIEKVVRAFQEPFEILGTDVRVTCSLGIAMYPDDGREADTLMRNADAAMYRSKEAGRNTYQFYEKEMTAAAFEHIIVENALRNALVNDEFFLVYQPQFSLDDSTIAGVETLLRWQHPDLGLVAPSHFIPIAEQSGQIREIDSWVMSHASRQARAWLDAGHEFGHVACNVSGQQLQHSGFFDSTVSALRESNLPPSHLEVEVTETYLITSTEEAVGALRSLRQLGVHVSIDDFGTGYSSMAHLKRLPVSKLKIDQSFVQDLATDTDAVEICKAIIAMASAMGLEVIAEGIETVEQLQVLRELGCTHGQGFYLSVPLAVDAMTELLAEQLQPVVGDRPS